MRGHQEWDLVLQNFHRSSSSHTEVKLAPPSILQIRRGGMGWSVPRARGPNSDLLTPFPLICSLPTAVPVLFIDIMQHPAFGHSGWVLFSQWSEEGQWRPVPSPWELPTSACCMLLGCSGLMLQCPLIRILQKERSMDVYAPLLWGLSINPSTCFMLEHSGSRLRINAGFHFFFLKWNLIVIDILHIF